MRTERKRTPESSNKKKCLIRAAEFFAAAAVIAAGIFCVSSRPGLLIRQENGRDVGSYTGEVIQSADMTRASSDHDRMGGSNEIPVSGGTAEFSLHSGERITFPSLPGGTVYQVWEETPTGWQIADRENTSGEIPASGTAGAEFTNEFAPGTATVQLVATKTLDGKSPEEGAYTFRLEKDGEIIDEAVNSAGGVILFRPLVLEDPGEYIYTITEVRGDDAGISYDPHEETVTVSVIDDGEGTLTASAVYDSDGAGFENETKPGVLTVTKQTDGGGDPEEEFEFEIRLTDPLGRSLDAVNIISDRK